jgi:predicted phosphoribosyltransferase
MVIDSVGVDEPSFLLSVEMEIRELDQRLRAYRETTPAVDPRERTVIVVDDGLATGSTALAAIEGFRAREASEVWLAVPVAPADVIPVMERAANRVVVLAKPRRFMAVGAWYRDFSQTSDSEVTALLQRSRPHG